MPEVETHRPIKSESAFRTISEVADDLDVPQHVLRFWETKFTQLRPMKRGGGRRYYRPEDVALLRRIRGLLYDDGFTIKGVQKLLKEGGGRLPAPHDDAVRPAKAVAVADVVEEIEAKAVRGALTQDVKGLLRDVLTDLGEVRDMLRGVR